MVDKMVRSVHPTYGFIAPTKRPAPLPPTA